jgi:hypothetical protein
MAEQDEKPEIEEPGKAAEETAEVVKDAPEVAKEPEPEVKHTSEDIPEWGKQLKSDVEALAAAVAKPVEEGLPEGTMPGHDETVGDATPVRRPWHKRGFFGGE